MGVGTWRARLHEPPVSRPASHGPGPCGGPSRTPVGEIFGLGIHDAIGLRPSGRVQGIRGGRRRPAGSVELGAEARGRRAERRCGRSSSGPSAASSASGSGVVSVEARSGGSRRRAATARGAAWRHCRSAGCTPRERQPHPTAGTAMRPAQGRRARRPSARPRAVEAPRSRAAARSSTRAAQAASRGRAAEPVEPVPARDGPDRAGPRGRRRSPRDTPSGPSESRRLWVPIASCRPPGRQGRRPSVGLDGGHALLQPLGRRRRGDRASNVGPSAAEEVTRRRVPPPRRRRATRGSARRMSAAARGIGVPGPKIARPPRRP